MAAFLVLVMWRGLLPGLLCVCLGFLVTRWLSPRLPQLWPWRQQGHAASWPKLAGALVAVFPLLLIALAIPRTRGLILDAPHQYRELLGYMANTVLELRQKLPPNIAAQLPDGADDLQHVIARYLAAQSGVLAHTGRTWLSGLIFAYVGLLTGVLAAIRPTVHHLQPLAAQLHLRARRFGETFRQIVVAQFWISLLNTSLTAIFLLAVLPLWGVRLPYTVLLLLLTFIAGLIPIVGNLICNTVLTLVGLSISLPVALACLAFLILIHKAEYFVNAKVIGSRTHIGVWELLAVMFVMEALFGPSGLVAAPLFYAYAKKELQASGWV
ncbi:MAG: AI-2E family transporter [Burkholderiaceae bacterium]|jgi:predicted PurR-regulated permease PerM|nr:AI-2E family transporter [Burkholderiaceae bacterium]